MSRCFPFPPPGYENKARIDQVDLLIKNHKEKKHKKEKREKEKREGKEKKDKDRSKDRHKERKYHKEKAKDEKKDKDRRINEQINGHDEVKFRDSRQRTAEDMDSQFKEESGTKIRDEEKGVVENFTDSSVMEKGRGSNNNMLSNPIGKMTPNLNGIDQRSNHGMGGSNNNMLSNSIGKMTPNLNGIDQRSNHGMGASNNNMLSNSIGKMTPNLNGIDQRSNHGKGRPVIVPIRVEGLGTAGSMEKGRGKVNGMVGNHDSTGQRKNGGVGRSLAKETENNIEWREKGELKHSKVHDKPRDNGKKDPVDSLSIMPLAPHRDKFNGAVPNGNIKKRKDSEMNGSLHENDVRAGKFPRTSSSSHPPLENGRTMVATPSTWHGAANKIVAESPLDNKEHNTIDIAAPRPSDDSNPSKPPHPDLKYLARIYSVPKVEEWVEPDDQEWLLINDTHQPKPKTKSGAEETLQVWAEALQIDSADIIALPYVIPL